MATATAFTRTSVARSERTTDTDTQHTEQFAERYFPSVAMGGAVIGALAGAVLSIGSNTVTAELTGFVGTIIGSVVATVAWSLIAPFASRSE